MPTPSEILAAKILEKLGFKNLMFVNKHYDFQAEDSVIEVKSSSKQQIQGLRDALKKGYKVYLIMVEPEGSFCLFKLIGHVRRKTQPKLKVRIKSDNWLVQLVGYTLLQKLKKS
jgi:hypothetical protein